MAIHFSYFISPFLWIKKKEKQSGSATAPVALHLRRLKAVLDKALFIVRLICFFIFFFMKFEIHLCGFKLLCQ